MISLVKLNGYGQSSEEQVSALTIDLQHLAFAMTPRLLNDVEQRQLREHSRTPLTSGLTLGTKPPATLPAVLNEQLTALELKEEELPYRLVLG